MPNWMASAYGTITVHSLLLKSNPQNTDLANNQIKSFINMKELSPAPSAFPLKSLKYSSPSGKARDLKCIRIPLLADILEVLHSNCNPFPRLFLHHWQFRTLPPSIQPPVHYFWSVSTWIFPFPFPKSVFPSLSPFQPFWFPHTPVSSTPSSILHWLEPLLLQQFPWQPVTYFPSLSPFCSVFPVTFSSLPSLCGLTWLSLKTSFCAFLLLFL